MGEINLKEDIRDRKKANRKNVFLCVKNMILKIRYNTLIEEK